MIWNKVKRGVLFGTGAGLATVGIVTLAPAGGVALGLLGAFGICTKTGLVLSGCMSFAGFAFGAKTENELKIDIATVLNDAIEKDKKNSDVMHEISNNSKIIRAKLEEWNSSKSDLMHLVSALVGAACADGNISEVEENCIRNEVFGVSFLALPQADKEEIARSFNVRVTLENASDHFKKIDCASLRGLTRNLMDVVMTCDAESGALHQREINFLTAWDVLSGNDSTTAA